MFCFVHPVVIEQILCCLKWQLLSTEKIFLLQPHFSRVQLPVAGGAAVVGSRACRPWSRRH